MAGQLGRTRGLTLVALIVGMLLLAAPAGAIIGGEVDGNGHPYAGAIDARQIGLQLTPSGVLISPTVYLTAGHVTRRWDDAGVTRARVTFDPVSVSVSATWYTGTVHTDPAFDPGKLNDDRNDLGVVVFDAPIPGITPASLPTQGLLDALGPEGSHGQTFNTVGYGISRFTGGSDGRGKPQPDFTSGGTRKVAQETFMSLTPGWLRLQQHQDGQICIGDSGSPSLLGDSNVITGIVIAGGPCTLGGSGQWDMRVDTPSARAFLGQYVALP
jgi:hypothetical protein